MRKTSRKPTNRDLLLLRVSPRRVLLITCDSSGGVGPKRSDSLKAPGGTVGKYLARTVLLELLCAGAKLLALSCSLSLEYEPTGKLILEGVRRASLEMGSIPPITYSSEKNFTIDTTGVGITAIGVSSERRLRIGISKPGDAVIMLGRPCAGAGVLEAEQRGLIPSIKDVSIILRSKMVHDMIPVGSTGLWHETRVLAEDSHLDFEPLVDSKRLRLSGGPSTALIATVQTQKVDELRENVAQPFEIIGYLIG